MYHVAISFMVNAFKLYSIIIECIFCSRVWDMEVRAPLVSSPAPHAVRSLAFSPDGQLLAAGMQNGSFSVHNVRYGMKM